MSYFKYNLCLQLAAMVESLTEEYNNVKSALLEQPSPLDTKTAKEGSER